MCAIVVEACTPLQQYKFGCATLSNSIYLWGCLKLASYCFFYFVLKIYATLYGRPKNKRHIEMHHSPPGVDLLGEEVIEGRLQVSLGKVVSFDSRRGDVGR